MKFIPQTVLTKNTKHSYLILFILVIFLVTPIIEVVSADDSKIIVGVLEYWPPQYTMNEKTNMPDGFAVEIMNEIGRLSKLRIEYKTYKTWPKLNKALRDKQIDVIPNMGITAEREPYFNFTKPLEASRILFFKRKTSTDINSDEDLRDRDVSVVETNKGRYLLEEKNWQNIRIYKSLEEALMSVLSGNSDALVYPDPPLTTILLKHGLENRIESVGVPLLEVKRGICTHKDKKVLAEKLNEAVFSFLDSNKYREIYSKWYGQKEDFWNARRVLWSMTGLLVCVALLLVAWRFYSLGKMNKQLKKYIGDRKRSEEALQASHKQFLTVLDGIDATVYVVDMKTYEIIFMNKHMIETYGRDMTGEICWNAFRGESKPCKHCPNDKLVDKNGKPAGVHTWQALNPIVEKWYINYDRAIEWTDGRLVKLQIATDITDFKKMEEQFQQAQKMESVGRLAGGVAHDYNNALTAIMGYTELALMNADPNDPLHNDLKEVLKASRHAKDITRQLLAFARKQTIAPIVLDLNTSIESMLKMLRRLIGENIDLVWLPGKGLWSVKMDPSQIDQILANLCVNARDAIEGVGKITIETATKIFDLEYCADHTGFVPGEFVMLTISDNGCGMDKEILNNIFEPFFTTKDVDRGTGLGLSTVYGIVKQNNGFINVYSEPGKGTTIKIYLPQHEGKAVEIQEENKAKIPLGQGETILVVEDDVPILKLAQKILKGLEYNVMIADSPKRAMRLAEEYTDKIHLLVTDVIMPEMNGRELSEQFKSIYPDLNCIFMSGYTANTIAHHGVLDEGIHFIQKPFSKRDLATIIRKALDEGKS